MENKEVDYIKSVLTEDKAKALIYYKRYYFQLFRTFLQRR